MYEPPPHTSDAVEVFVASLRQRSVPVNTIKSYAHDLCLFVQFAPADLPTVTAETIQVFLASFSHLSAATRRRRYSTLCTFYHWLIRHGVVETNPMERLDPIEQVEREPRPLPLQPEPFYTSTPLARWNRSQMCSCCSGGSPSP